MIQLHAVRNYTNSKNKYTNFVALLVASSSMDSLIVSGLENV